MDLATIKRLLEQDSPAKPISTLQKELRANGHTVTEAELQLSMEDGEKAGQIFRHPPKHKGNKDRFHVVSALDYTQTKILAAVQGAMPTRKQLAEAVPSAYQRFLKKALDGLSAQGRVFRFKKGRYERFSAQKPRPTDLLSATQVNALEACVRIVSQARHQPLTMEALTEFLNGAAEPRQLDEVLLREWYEADLPRRHGISSIPIPWTWKRFVDWSSDVSPGARPSPDAFHEVLHRMADEHSIQLLPHNEINTVDRDEHAILPTTSDGEKAYYWSM